MRISINCDTYLNFIIDLRKELEFVWEKVNEKYKNIKTPSTIGIAFRCLPNEIERKTFRRFDKKDAYLTLDITVSYEEYKKMYKTEIRHDLGHTFYNYLEDSLKKYKFKEVNSKELLSDIKNWCNEIGWLEEEVDYSKDLDYPE
ncbi:conserved hypothetical protein [Tenacibaculum maritimum]|uniref:hypothetical protein n=1 Tax=Tenacibaculum maritimum TaxID=107401 RepID=UPI0012E41A38|nr:hypothetical protein [Tenacibaculum maritimum]MDB0601960.1 hypothetical protein [Tenacibaculum maritimum]MDB0613890.1 hypothetical protein [Tenacibaculum maritimum]CAA0177765.1 conserved hypothetical protein [Tenacibaculum maritimum]CAA0217380.1 conserved hypothetical protein [Tenacibaculum maritimum]